MKINLFFKPMAVLLAFSLFSRVPVVEAQESLLQDLNGDGVVTYLGFGDSITFGVGDGNHPAGAGYVFRLGLLHFCSLII